MAIQLRERRGARSRAAAGRRCRAGASGTPAGGPGPTPTGARRCATADVGGWISKLSTCRTVWLRPLLVTGRWRLVVTSPMSSRMTRAAHSAVRARVAHRPSLPRGSRHRTRTRRTARPLVPVGIRPASRTSAKPGTGPLYRWITPASQSDRCSGAHAPDGRFGPTQRHAITQRIEPGQPAVRQRLAAGLAAGAVLEAANRRRRPRAQCRRRPGRAARCGRAPSARSASRPSARAARCPTDRLTASVEHPRGSPRAGRPAARR